MLTREERLRILKENSINLHKETVACIKNTLIELMKEKRYVDITMTDVINRSGVSRGGVYNSYKSTDEILLDIVSAPIDEAIAALTDSIFDNMEATFTIGKKYESSVKAVIDAGLENEFLKRMNKRFEGASDPFYVTLWNGMIYNAFIEWARAGMPGALECVIEELRKSLRQVADSIMKSIPGDAE